MKSELRKIGDVGEEIASKFLMKHGFTILERNYLKPWGEIDLVCQKEKTLHFVEVNAALVDSIVNRETQHDYNPLENVHKYKIERLHKAIFSYLEESNRREDWQLDVISVLITRDFKRTKITLLQDII